MIFISFFAESPGPHIDDGDHGYRHIVGIPGGKYSPLFPELERANDGLIEIKEGIGNDMNNLIENQSTWIMDSNEFKFSQGEISRQFNDGEVPDQDYP